MLMLYYWSGVWNRVVYGRTTLLVKLEKQLGRKRDGGMWVGREKIKKRTELKLRRRNGKKRKKTKQKQKKN